MSNWLGKALSAIGIAAIAGNVWGASAQVFVSPGSIVTSQGGGYTSTAPFNNVARYEQIYDASQFLPLRGPDIIWCRADAANGYLANGFAISRRPSCFEPTLCLNT